MNLAVDGTRLWFDVDGLELVPDGTTMSRRPTVLAIHGGPAGYDHSYLKPHLGRLTALAQVVYVDLPGHGRSARCDPAAWSLERCADDLRRLCDQLGIVRPVVFGHSMGGFVALQLALRHPGSVGGLLLQATAARHDPQGIVEEFRARFGPDLAEVAELVFTTTDEVPRAMALRCLRAFGPRVPSEEVLARVVANADLRTVLPQLARFDVVDRLDRVRVPTLVTVGELDPVTPVAAARQIVDHLPHGAGQLAVFDGAGHFPWLDAPERYWRHLDRYLEVLAAPAT